MRNFRLDFVCSINQISVMKATACITVSLPRDVLGAIDEIKAREERTRSQIVDRLLRAGLATVSSPMVSAPAPAVAEASP
jgi:hypothetical protein